MCHSRINGLCVQPASLSTFLSLLALRVTLILSPLAFCFSVTKHCFVWNPADLQNHLSFTFTSSLLGETADERFIAACECAGALVQVKPRPFY